MIPNPGPVLSVLGCIAQQLHLSLSTSEGPELKETPKPGCSLSSWNETDRGLGKLLSSNGSPGDRAHTFRVLPLSQW